MKPHFVIDKNIPYIKGVFDDVADIDYLAAKEINRYTIKDADALIIRTRTKCNHELLDGSRINLIATATIGIDHIDTNYCLSKKIKFNNSPGCNASSVAQYVGAAISYWAKKNNETIKGKTIGIIGHGHVGKEVEKICKTLGLKALLNDPFLESSDTTKYNNLQTIASKCDIITFHTPLTHNGLHPTFHIGDRFFFDSIGLQKPLIINAARGGVIDEIELIRAIKKGTIADCVIDCWEGEPNINLELLHKSTLSTPHIAGYSADGKLNATKNVVKIVSEHFKISHNEIVGLSEQKEINTTTEKLAEEILKDYDITYDSDILKENPEKFEEFRGNYRERREAKYIIL